MAEQQQKRTPEDNQASGPQDADGKAPRYKPKCIALNVGAMMREDLSREDSSKLKNYKPSSVAMEVTDMVRTIKGGETTENYFQKKPQDDASANDDGSSSAGGAMVDDLVPEQHQVAPVHTPNASTKNEDEDTEDDTDGKYRDRDQEMAQQNITDVEAENLAGDSAADIAAGAQMESGYGRDLELGALDEQAKEAIKDSINHEREANLERPDKIHSSSRLKSFLNWKSGAKLARMWMNKTVERIVNVKFLKDLDKRYMRTHVSDIKQEVERLSTHRHHSVVAPGNQAGIFDNKIEKDLKKAEKVKNRAKMADNGLSVVSMEQVASPEKEVQRKMNSDPGLNTPGVDKSDLGKFTHDAIINQQEADKQRGI